MSKNLFKHNVFAFLFLKAMAIFALKKKNKITYKCEKSVTGTWIQLIDKKKLYVVEGKSGL